MPQEEINHLLIGLAKEGLNVVRLKGGDPFVFGRGSEEILALKEAGISWETVPGITSAVAYRSLRGFPSPIGYKPQLSCDYRSYLNGRP